MTNYFRKYIHRDSPSSEHLLKVLLPAILTGLLFISGSCDEEPSLVGGKLLPGDDFVTIESSLLPVRSYTMYRDSVPSQMQDYSFLGSLYDPYFGTTTCEFVSQLRMGTEWGGGVFVVDSVKLYLKLLTVEGDTADTHFLRMSEIADVLNDSLTYYSSQSVALTGYTITDIELPTLRKDTINFIALSLPKNFAEYLLRNPSMLFQSDTVPDFRTYFRGLYFQMISPADPMFVTLSVASPTGYYNNYFEIYGEDDLGTEKTMTFLLDALIENTSFNLYKHDHSTGQAGKKLEHIDDLTYLDTMSYSQTFNGVYTKLFLDKLDSIKNAPELDNISVNKARLKIPVYYDNDIYGRKTIPNTLYLRYLTASGGRTLVPETGTVFYNGTADTTGTSIEDDVYNLNIATYVQRYLEDESNDILPELELILQPNAGNNVILKANGSYKPIKFEFTYTKF